MTKETSMLFAGGETLELADAQARERLTAMEMTGGYDPETYTGVDLTIKYADDIMASPYNGDAWAWIRARIRSADFAGMHVGDWIPWTSSDGYSFKAMLAGIDTYYQGGDTYNIPHHIDFICAEAWPQMHAMNKTEYNNGMKKTDAAAVKSPWLASDLYHWLNSLSGEVPGGTGAGGNPVSVDYTASGVYDKLPAALRAVIVEKRAYIPGRYTDGSKLNHDNSAVWTDIGKLWIPSETEYNGTPVFGDSGFGASGFVQYPIFRSQKRLLIGHRKNLWSLSAAGENASAFCVRLYSGQISYLGASYSGTNAPICFRIA